MICIEERPNSGLYVWRDEGGKTPVELDHLAPAVVSRFKKLKSQRVGERIERCGSRLMSNVFLIYEESDYGNAGH
ncbi:hypothetical protein GCM10027343_14610 [Noviherbaspirillum agri]